jgi:D-amino-acid oxidase
MSRVVVIGAGVSGLTSALVLEEAGFDVQVITAAKGAATTSAAAGAVWFPYRVGPPERASKWAARTRIWLTELSRTHPEAGVDMLTRVEVAETDERPWWSDAAPGIELLRAPDKRIPRGPDGNPVAPFAWRVEAPRCEPAIYLAWLEARLRHPVTIRKIERLEDVDADLIINCTGLAARTLTADRELQGVYGQTVITAPGDIDLKGGLGDERDESQIFYSIPRRREVVLGGCAEVCADDRPAAPTPEMTRAILQRAHAFGLNPGPVIRESAGLRPYRPTVRLERFGRVIHNYGHGGAGYTLSRGCAEEVLALARG